MGESQRPVEEVVNNYYGDDRGEHGGHDVSADERSIGESEDKEVSGKDDRDSLYGSGDNSGSDFSDSNDGGNDDASFDDGGGDFGDDGSGGGDDSNFA